MTARWGVVLAFDGKRSVECAGRFVRLDAARKECDRQNASAWFRVDTPGDLLRGGSFRYRWRVWDFWHRRFA